jgi:hypothetical protein
MERAIRESKSWLRPPGRTRGDPRAAERLRRLIAATIAYVAYAAR